MHKIYRLTITCRSTQDLWLEKIFKGNKSQDVDKFIHRIESTALKSNRDDDEFKTRLVSLLLEGEARIWYEDRLDKMQKGNWARLCEALRGRFEKTDDSKGLWK